MDERVAKLADFLDLMSREPSVSSLDTEERALASWLAKRRHSARTLDGTPRQDENAYLDHRGYRGILLRDGRESLSNTLTRSLCVWMLEHGREPRHGTTDLVEAHMYHVLYRKRNRSKLYPSDTEIASGYGLPNILQRLGKEERSNAMAMAYNQWLEAHGGKKPSHRSPERVERSLAAWKHNRDSALRGSIRKPVYESDTRILLSRKEGEGHESRQDDRAAG